MDRLMNRLLARRRTQQGQTLPLVSLCVVTLMVGAALGVDIGSLAATNRRLQAVADLAAIDGARALTGEACNAPIDTTPGAPTQQDHITASVLASAARNDFAVGGDKTLVIELGELTRTASNGVPDFNLHTSCTASDFPNAVRVRAGDRTGFSFGKVIGQDSRTSTRESFASRGNALEGEGAFSLGSALATVDSSRSTILNSTLGQMLCHPASCNIGLDAVAYDGLVHSDITFGALATQLGFGTTNELFTTDVEIDRILEASALLLDGDTAAELEAITALAHLQTAVTGSQKIKLGDLVSADLLTGNEAADVGVNIFQLVTGTAAIANGTNAVSISNLGVSVPGVASVAVSFALIEPPVVIGKTPGATRTTKQLSLTVTPKVDLSTATLAGLQLATVKGDLTMKVTGGVAKGTLTGVRCGDDKGIDVKVEPTAATVTTSGTLTLTLNTGTGSNASLLKTLGGLLTTVVGGELVTTSLSVSGAGASTSHPAGGYDLSFAYPGQFGPDGAVHVGNTTVGFENITYGAATLNTTLKVLPLLGIIAITTNASINVNAAAVGALVQPITSEVDEHVIQPLMEALGLDLGAADVAATSLLCGVPRLG